MKLLPKLLDENCVFLKVCWNIGKSSTLAGVSSCVSLRYFNLAKEHHPCLKFEGFTDRKEPFPMATLDYQRLNPQDVAPTVLSIGWSSPFQYKYSHHQSELPCFETNFRPCRMAKWRWRSFTKLWRTTWTRYPRPSTGTGTGPGGKSLGLVMVMMVIPRKPNPNHRVFLGITNIWWFWAGWRLITNFTIFFAKRHGGFGEKRRGFWR